MRSYFAFLVIIGILILGAGCISGPQGGGGNETNIMNYPPGYEVKDYCERDSDCFRQVKCCDCGEGEYVNKYHIENPLCSGPRCLCPIMDTVGACRSNRCVPAPAQPVIPDNSTKRPGFCGWSTGGSCSSDADCRSGGCSGQVCQSKSEPTVATTCEFAQCYDAASYGVLCACVSGSCRWE